MDVLEKMDSGPGWCKEISQFEKNLVEEGIVKPLNSLIELFRDLKAAKSKIKKS